MTRILNWYIGKYTFNTKEGSNGGVEEQTKHMKYRKQIAK